MAGDLAALDQLSERVVDLGEVGEVVEAVGALLQLSGGLRAAQHEDGEQRDLSVIEPEGLVEQGWSTGCRRCAAS